ncbi:hypothetical protein [Cellulomonas sp. B6]|uniref:hypothetical protein n=1 Tax=Cellulomonas sp. B6 TaxID=1295626 RepID=UPI0012373F6D|nr:hypothetical protein [Cellulomonas sp. B6]
MQSKKLADTAIDIDWQFLDRLVFEPGLVQDPPQLAWSWPLDGPAEDWIGTADMTRLVSPAVREVLDAHLGGADRIQWLDATVQMPDGSALPYFVMHFPDWHDDLYDEASTTWGPGGLPIRWVLSRAKLKDHRVFALPNLSKIVIVSGDVVDALKDAGLTGIAVTPARVA